MEKVEKSELLHHYRIAMFSNITELLGHIATKKGLLKKETVEVEKKVNSLGTNRRGKLKKQSDKVQVMEEVRQVPDHDGAARRLIRDFLNNRLSYYSKPE